MNKTLKIYYLHPAKLIILSVCQSIAKEKTFLLGNRLAYTEKSIPKMLYFLFKGIPGCFSTRTSLLKSSK